jgi:hypothetical protein
MKLSMSAPHQLDVATVRGRIEARVRHYDQRYPRVELMKHHRWLDDRHVRAEYRGGEGTISIDEKSVSVDMELPFFARIYRGRIEEFVRTELAQVTTVESAGASVV